MFTILGKISIIDRVIIAYTREDLSAYKVHFDNPVCDVCCTNHVRNELYIVDEDGVRYTAGKGCLDKKYGKELVRSALDAASVEQHDIATNCFTTKSSIIAALYQHDTEGYEKGTSNGDFKARHGSFYVEAMYGANSQQYSNLADKVIDHFANIDPTNTFIESLKTIAYNQYHSDKVLGLFPAMINCYYRDVEYARQQLIIEQHKLHSIQAYGNEGDKVKDVNLVCTIMDVRTVNNDYYGQFTQTFLKDEQGHVFVWSNVFKHNGCTSCGVGSIIKLINFTIKKHFTNKFGNVAAISRPKYQVIELKEQTK